MLVLVNDARADAGVAALRNNTQLDAAAGTRSSDMAAAGKLSHDGWSTTIVAAGYRGGALGENIAYGYSSPTTVVNAWLNSSGHRANILRPYFRDSGVGCVKDDRGRLWWTQDFGG